MKRSSSVPYKKSAQFTNKKTVSLTPEIGQMWETLSRQHKVEVVEAIRPLIEDEVRRLYQTVVEDRAS